MARSLRSRLANLEQSTVTEEVRLLEKLLQLQREFSLPLPEGIPSDVLREGERRIFALQSRLRATSDRDQWQGAAAEFHDWVLSIHEQYGQKK